jgi:neutral ceramidase
VWENAVMMTGAASHILEPQLPISLAGRGGAPRICSQINDTLEVNTIVFDDGEKSVAIVSIDTLFCCTDFKDRVLAKLYDAKIGSLFLVASHTHNAPSLDRTKPLLGQTDEAFYDMAVVRVARSISEALEGLQSVHRVDEGVSDVLANNRRRRRSLRIITAWPFASWETCLVPSVDTNVPHILRVLVGRNSDSTPIWCMWTWPCHPTAFPHDLQISADFPGAVRNYLREQLGSASLPVLHLPGAAGDLRVDVARGPVSLLRRLQTPFARQFAGVTGANFQLIVDKLEIGIARAFENQTPKDLSGPTSIRSVEIRLSDIMPGTIDSRVVAWHKLSIGQLDLLLVGAELCSSWLPVLGNVVSSDAWISGYCDDVPCYLPTQKQVAEGGYEASGFQSSFGLKQLFSGDMQDQVMNEVRKFKARF